MNYDEGKATRAPEMHGVVESQRTERYQAVDPTYWGEKPPALPWRWVAPLIVVAFVVGLSIVGAFAIDWSRAGKLAVALPVVIVALVVLKRLR
jgi:hypothetical protein